MRRFNVLRARRTCLDLSRSMEIVQSRIGNALNRLCHLRHLEAEVGSFRFRFCGQAA